jgi:two-component system, LytTR family, sensor kinase
MRPLPPRRRAVIRRIATGILIAGTLALVRQLWRLIVLPPGTNLVPFSIVAATHVFWLCAAPVVLHLAYRALAPTATRRQRLALAAAVTAALVGEPLWAWMVVELAHYDSSLRSLVVGRSDLNLMVVVLLVGLELMELRVESAREQLARHARLLRSVAEAQLGALTLHLQPHFLFNTIQLVAECARTDAAQAARVVCALRRLLVESARHTARRVVSAAEEIDFIRAYLSIQLTRFEERLRVEIDVDPKAANAAVPHMLLQPIVENAIQHGIGRRAQGGSISVIVRAIEAGTRLLVLVRDDGPGPANELRVRGRQGRGTTNTRARLAAMYGDDFVFALRQIGHHGAETRIDIPLREVRATADGERVSEELAVDAPLTHRTWLSRLALAWTLLLLLPPAALMLLTGDTGPSSSTVAYLFRTQLRELPIYLLAIIAAEFVERLRRDDARDRWFVGAHLLAAGAVIWARDLATPLLDYLLGTEAEVESLALMIGLRVLFVYGATVALARAHMLTHWAAARSSVVRDVNEALMSAERDVCRAQVHQAAVLSSLRALEESCDVGAEAVDRRAQSLAKLLRLCLDALDAPEHDVEAELRIADAYCAMFDVDGIVWDVPEESAMRAVLPPGTIATAIASLGARPTDRPTVRAAVVASRLELSVSFRTSGMVSELAALQRTLNGAVRGGVLVRRRMSGAFTRVELSLPLLGPTDITPDVASDVLLSA